MNVRLGVALIVAGSVGGLCAFAFWRRLALGVALVTLTVAGLLVATGALLVQDDASVAEWAITLVALGVLTPVHGRLVFGPPGRRGGGPMVADGSAAAYKGRNR